MSRINGFLGRRELLKLVGAGITATIFSESLWSEQQSAIANINSANPNPINFDQALQNLLDGNQRFIHKKRKSPHQSLEHLRLVAKAQYPFAAILGCADSRVPTEIIFDQGLGDLFVVRVAGNVASDMAIGSLEYSTAVLGTQLIVVLGHRRCGAVAEAIKNELLPGRIGYIVENIKPAIANINSLTGDVTENAVIANIKYQAAKLQQSSTILARSLHEGKLKIVSAYYNLDTGKIDILV
ncbi:MAG: carbonic anhydrase [Desmonostoc vinosum HA7617-LM4]|jgi:carbonic anhydrase|nr:carbonic anhydrase [Desmonostoc vinosum HA7617-LM4]